MTIVERINSERVVLFGWSRAILLQIAHPLVAAGILEHSSFRGGIVQAAVRLHHTVGAMLSLTFGGPDRHAEAVSRIRAIHRTVNGTLAAPVGPFAAGTRYSAEDPALLLWVHATLLDSVADIYHRLIAPLDEADRDEVCRESARLVDELGGDVDSAPLSWRALQQYMSGMYASGTLALTPEARELAMAVLSPRAAGLPMPFGRAHRLVTAGLLPPQVRDLYGFKWDARRERRFQRMLWWLRRARRVSPPIIALWPAARKQEAARIRERGSGIRD